MLVVDTDVVSYLFTRGDLYKSHLHGHLLVISPMTRAELEDWALITTGDNEDAMKCVPISSGLSSPLSMKTCV